jgi:uncharacterized protein (DUF433 family)
MSPASKRLDAQTQKTVMYALRHARGRYVADRASQLSGIPRSTLYDWRREDIYVPDFDAGDPTAWSYRDLVYLRLLGWLRNVGMPRPAAANRVKSVKRLIEKGDDVRLLHATHKTLLINEEATTRFDEPNLLPFDNLFGLVSTFDLLDPIEELRRRGQNRLWAPDLVTPSDHTFISPWVLAGDPCVEATRIPTSAIHALREERGLSSAEVVELYPGLTIEAADDAHVLEQRLRGLELPEPLAA